MGQVSKPEGNERPGGNTLHTAGESELSGGGRENKSEKKTQATVEIRGEVDITESLEPQQSRGDENKEGQNGKVQRVVKGVAAISGADVTQSAQRRVLPDIGASATKKDKHENLQQDCGGAQSANTQETENSGSKGDEGHPGGGPCGGDSDEGRKKGPVAGGPVCDLAGAGPQVWAASQIPLQETDAGTGAAEECRQERPLAGEKPEEAGERGKTQATCRTKEVATSRLEDERTFDIPLADFKYALSESPKVEIEGLALA